MFVIVGQISFVCPVFTSKQKSSRGDDVYWLFGDSKNGTFHRGSVTESFGEFVLLPFTECSNEINSSLCLSQLPFF